MAARCRLIFDANSRIADWCEARIEHFSGWGSDPRCIGLEVDGALRAGVVYTNFSGANIFASIAADGPLTRKFMFAIFWCPFVQFGVRHITCSIEESNVKSVHLCTRMGFVLRGRLPEAAADGGDIVLMGMLRRDCRFLSWGPNR